MYANILKLWSITFSLGLSNEQFFPKGHPGFGNPARRLTWRASCNPFRSLSKGNKSTRTSSDESGDRSLVSFQSNSPSFQTAPFPGPGEPKRTLIHSPGQGVVLEARAQSGAPEAGREPRQAGCAGRVEQPPLRPSPPQRVARPVSTGRPHCAPIPGPPARSLPQKHTDTHGRGVGGRERQKEGR